MFHIRDLIPQDIPALLALVHADQLPAQPYCTIQEIQQALVGQTTIDRAWWQTLMTIHTIVATRDERIVGCASYGLQKVEQTGTIPADGSGCLLWLHAQEEPAVIDVLLDAVMKMLSPCPRIYAFWFATPLTLGLEGLPVAHRPMTHRALLAHQFRGHDDWLYMAGPTTPHAEKIAEVETTPYGWDLVVHEQQERIAEADIALGKDQVGHLRWLWVREDQRGRGLGTCLFLQASAHLYAAGARSMILYVDHDDPIERDRIVAIRLYQQHGFTVIDHLWSYWYGAPPSWLTQ